MSNRRSLTAWLPHYSIARSFLQIIEGTSFSRLQTMLGQVWEKTGTPLDPVDWSDPGAWIPARLSGDNAAIARRLWEASNRTINPRYCGGLTSICKTHDLIHVVEDQISLSDAGRSFLNEDAAQIARMDKYDGIMVILNEIAARSPSQRKHLLPAFRHFCHTYTTWRSHGSVSSALGYRLANLVKRDLIEKSGQSYAITIFGLDYLERFSPLAIDGNRTESGQRDASSDPGENLVNSILRLADQQSEAARDQLKRHLQSMNPTKFEHLIKLLLEEMNYDNVQVTSASRDKGVDVVANIQLGISSAREVVQVKRQQSNIMRPVLDQLRGSLHYFNAVRGTIITTGGFTKGTIEAAFLPGAPPITLIDGETLLDMLIEHGIGVKRREVSYFEFDSDSLAISESDDEPDLD